MSLNLKLMCVPQAINIILIMQGGELQLQPTVHFDVQMIVSLQLRIRRLSLHSSN